MKPKRVKHSPVQSFRLWQSVDGHIRALSDATGRSYGDILNTLLAEALGLIEPDLCLKAQGVA